MANRVAIAAPGTSGRTSLRMGPISLVTYASLAGVTKTLELVTGVIILPQRQTVLFAKQAADVDLFSDGRLRLGVGSDGTGRNTTVSKCRNIFVAAADGKSSKSL